MNDLIDILASKLCNLSEEYIILNYELDSTDKLIYENLDNFDKEFYRFQVEVIIFHYLQKIADEKTAISEMIKQLQSAKTIYTVTAHSKTGEHSYLVSSFSSEQKALEIARLHEQFRDDTYYCKIIKQDLDNYSDNAKYLLHNCK